MELHRMLSPPLRLQLTGPSHMMFTAILSTFPMLGWSIIGPITNTTQTFCRDG
jgi:hypothetical protein